MAQREGPIGGNKCDGSDWGCWWCWRELALLGARECALHLLTKAV